MSADLASLVGGLHAAFDTGEAMRWVSALTTWDRYQGSAGIGDAAEFVAAEAERVGLTDVEVTHHPADGRTSWWTFTAPTSWTPLSARLGFAGEPPLIRYPEQPFALGAGSAPAASEAVAVLPETAEWPRGAVVLLESAAALGPELFSRLRSEGARGFCVTTHPDRDGQLGRIELPADSGLFAFSVGPRQLAELRRGAAGGRLLRVDIALDPTVRTMPVVTARTPTGSGRECLLGAHLCHPAPSANDNASGVAAALGVGRLLARRQLRRPVRFVWGPEFVGLAAYTHELLAAGSPPPMLAVNLDMVGEDQRLCGGPLIVEESPEYLPHFLNAVVDACVRALPAAARSYSGAVGCDVWAWRTTPFVGASDHAVLADRGIACPAVQLGHWPDRFNHSGADTVDKVDPEELRRSATIAAAALALSAAADGAAAGAIAGIVTRWTAARMTACLPPTSDPHAAARLTRRWRYGRQALPTLVPLGADPAVLARHARWLDELHGTLGGAWPSPPPDPSASGAGAPAAGPPLVRAWPGPFNLRALLGEVTATDREWLLRHSLTDRGGFYARAMALAQSIDGRADAEGVRLAAELDSGLAIDAEFGQRFLAAMLRAGWSSEGTRSDEV